MTMATKQAVSQIKTDLPVERKEESGDRMSCGGISTTRLSARKE
jgi:hypothetical protein